MIAKTRAGSSKSFHETLHTKLLFPGIWLASPSRSSPNYWTQQFPVKAFHENFNVTSYYAEDIMVL